MPTRSPDVVAGVAREARWSRDMPAYKRLRQDGLQPRQIDGCGDLETRATHEKQIEMGTTIPSEKQIKLADTISRDVGLIT